MLQAYFSSRGKDSPLAPVVAACKRALRTVGLTSGVINLLTLTGSIFMMQVYDRVLGSQSLPTLWALSLIAVAAYAFQGWLETLRSRMFALLGEKIDADLGPLVQAAGLRAAVTTATGVQDAIQAQRDLDAIRGFVSGTGLVAAFDIPWILLYIAVATLLHPLFGLTTFLAATLLIWLTWKTEVSSKATLKQANDLSIKRNQMAEGIIRNSETVVANGMGANLARRLAAVQQQQLEKHREASFIVGTYANAAKTIRMVLQSFVLAIGAYLAIKGQITAGVIIGGSIIVARALAPIDQAIAGWRPFVAAREGHERLQKLLARSPSVRAPMALPQPKSTFAVRDLAVVAPGGQSFAVSGVSFNLKAGEVAAVIGQSAAGKSSLLRAIVGAWRLNRGQIEFDGTSPDQWSVDALGKSIGYLPQDFQLFDGTIAENIARFDADWTAEKVQRAAEAAGLDAYIRKAFPQTGYDTPLAAGAANLSGGQRQRIGLARALYGDPFLIVLDEPNSNLDRAGREALAGAIKAVKARGGIVIVSAHDHNVIAEADYLLTLHQGLPEWFGPRDEVFKRWLERHHPEALARQQTTQAVKTPSGRAPPAAQSPMASLRPPPRQQPQMQIVRPAQTDDGANDSSQTSPQSSAIAAGRNGASAHSHPDPSHVARWSSGTSSIIAKPTRSDENAPAAPATPTDPTSGNQL